MNNKKTFRKYAVSTMAAATAAAGVVPAAVSADTEVDFPDVSKDNVHRDAILKLAGEGVIQGFEDGTFRPYEEVTRSQVAVMLYELLDLEAPADLEGALAKYKDVDVDHRYAEQIAAVSEAEVFKGNLQGNFNPYDSITRQQMATVLVEGLGLAEFDNGEKVDINTENVSASHVDNVQILANLGITIALDDYKGYDQVTRQQFASFLNESIQVIEADKDKEPQVQSVSALDSKTVRVNFNRPLNDDVSAKNFEIDGDLTATDVELSNDKKSVVVTFNKDFTKDQEYELTAVGLLDDNGELYPETSGKFIWSVAEGYSVSLESTAIKSGDEIGLTVLDKDGKEVKNAKVKAVSLNNNILTSNATDGDMAPGDVVLTGGDLGGTVEVEVTTTLPDQSVLRDTFTVTVEEVEPEVTEAGFTFANFADGDATVEGAAYQYANTAAFESYAPNRTSITEGEVDVPFNAFEETDGNPDTSAVDWNDNDGNPATKVETTDSTVATANLNGSDITVDAHKPGDTKLIVTLKDGEKKTYDFKVIEKPEFVDIAVDTTSVNLSSENKGGGYAEGVNEKTVNVYTLDQYDEAKGLDFAPDNSKVTVSSSSDGIDIDGVDGDGNLVAADGNIKIQAKKDEAPVKDAKVTVSYFAKDTDDKPTSTKTIDLNVVEVDSDVDVSDLDVSVASEIDANADNVFGAVDNINYSNAKVYQLDADGNRIGVTNLSGAELESETDDVEVNDAILEFTAETPAHAQTYLRSADTVTVKVTDGEVSKNLTPSYKNSAVIPNAAKVSEKAVSVTLDGEDNALTMDQLLFGVADQEELVLDDDYSIAVKADAENSGYKYNKPLVSVTGTNGGENMQLGTSLYGSKTTELENGNLWSNDFINETLLNQGFEAKGFDYDVSVTNQDTEGSATVTNQEVTGLNSSEDSAHFRVVVKGIYIEGDDQVEANNLLSDSVQIDVTVNGSDETSEEN